MTDADRSERILADLRKLADVRRRQPAGTVTIAAEDAMWLAAGHLNNLAWQGHEESDEDDMQGCCTRCCGPCGALKRMLDAGQLDDILRPYTVDGWDWWNAAEDRLDRDALAKAWDPENCPNHDDEDEE